MTTFKAPEKHIGIDLAQGSDKAVITEALVLHSSLYSIEELIYATEIFCKIKKFRNLVLIRGRPYQVEKVYFDPDEKSPYVFVAFKKCKGATTNV